MAETTLNKKMRAFDDEVALAVAPFYLVHMLQRTLPARPENRIMIYGPKNDGAYIIEFRMADGTKR